MPPVLHLIFLLTAFICFALSAWLAAPVPAPDPLWRRIVSLGLTSLVASMISW